MCMLSYTLTVAVAQHHLIEQKLILEYLLGFLNDMIEQLWPNINVIGCRMVKEIVEPMFASMLPGPLASLKFVKLDLGSIPLRVSAVDVHKAENGGMKLDMDVIWEGDSDIDLDGKMVPKLVRTRSQDSMIKSSIANLDGRASNISI